MKPSCTYVQATVNDATEIKFYDYILLILCVYPDFVFAQENVREEES